MTQTKAQQFGYYRDEDDNDCLFIKDNLYLRFQEKDNKLQINLYDGDNLLIDFNELLPQNCDFSYSINQKNEEGVGSISHSHTFGYFFTLDIKDGRYKIIVFKPNSIQLKIGKGKLFYPLSILHELGHANLHTLDDKKNRLLEMEKEAWNYAENKAGEYKLVYEQEEMNNFIQRNLKTYKHP